MVILITLGQGLITIGMLLKGVVVRFVSCRAIFFVAIMPFGIGLGFPATAVASVAVYFILKNNDINYVWSFKTNIVES